MKALSVRQPWASAIANGEKTIECRSWQTKYRGELLICASGKKFVCDDGLVFPAGVALCVVELLAIRRMAYDDLIPACMGDFALEDVEAVLQGFAWEISLKYPIIPFSVKGKLNIYTIDASPEHLPQNYINHFDYLCKTQHINVEFSYNRKVISRI